MEPTDGAEGSTEPSVFALLQSKREPVAAAASKGKFAPKVKARPGARPAAAAAAATAAVKVKTEPNVLKEEPVKVEEVPLIKVKEEPRDDGRGKTKLEPEVLIEEEKKVEPIKVEPHKEEPHKEEPHKEEPHKEEPHKEEVNGSINEPMELDEPVQLDVPMLDEPVLKEPVVSTPGVDRIVREIDVFLTPHVDPETNLYVLQYPLRPYWRPYNLEERCQEVRIKPQLSKFEVDLVLDTDSENYDNGREEHLQIATQTLASSKVAMNTSYAIGILRGNQLFLNPVQAVVQFRPSMKYIDDHDAAKKKSNKDAGITDGDDEEMYDAEPVESKSELTLLQVNVRRRETERQEANRLQSHAYLKQQEEAEAWIPLEPHGTDSPVTEGIRQKMVTKTQESINFNMTPSAYLNTLVPGRASTSIADYLKGVSSSNLGISRSQLETLSIPDRVHKVFKEGLNQVLQFERLLKIVSCSEEELLAVLGNFAVLVQGCWVSGSHVRPEYGGVRPQRDYILFLFSKNRVVNHEQLRGLTLSKEALREIMQPIAVQRASVGWEFQEDTDKSFIKKHQEVFKQQTTQWASSEAPIKGALLDLNPYFPEEYGVEPAQAAGDKKKAVARTGTGKPSASKPPTGKPQGTKAGPAGEASNGDNGDTSVLGTMSMETRIALPGALKEIFARHHVCSMPIIVQSLRDMAIERTVSNSNAKAVAAAKAAAEAAKAPAAELTAAVNRVATCLGGVYFLTSLGNPTLDPFREVVIALLKKMGPNTGLRKTDIYAAFRVTGRDAPAPVYLKVMKELCYTRGGAWVLKPGDGRPS